MKIRICQKAMTIKRFITISVLLFLTLGASAEKKKQDYPRAEIKVSYNYHKKFMRGNDGVVEQNTPFILLANRNQSKFYCPSTEYRDSLLSTPSGRAKERQMFDAAVAAYVQNRDRSAMDGVVYHSRLYVTKDFAKSVSTTYDQAGMGECGYYDEPFSEIKWEIVEDSTRMILDISASWLLPIITEGSGRYGSLQKFLCKTALGSSAVCRDLLWRQTNSQDNIVSPLPELKEAHSLFSLFSIQSMRRWTEKTCFVPQDTTGKIATQCSRPQRDSNLAVVLMRR